MMKSLKGKFFAFSMISVFIVGASLMIPQEDSPSDLSVSKVLTILGAGNSNHFPKAKDFKISASRGEELIKEGIATKPGGGKTKKQSKHFVCTSCHNLEREDPDLTVADPQARLDYTSEHGLPFLQGSTLHGVVNRESFYNDDYYKKYGDLVVPARNDLREAIQLCAVECAQGRKLNEWELESTLTYLWTLQLNLSDLNLSKEELEQVYAAIDGSADKAATAALIKSKYLSKSPATFGTAYDSMSKNGTLTGDKENGKKIYENSCLHCHENKKYSFYHLDNEKLTFKHLSKKANGYGKHSLYQVSRYGVYSKSGKKSYMPQYPYEKMSDQQLEDLRAYIDFMAL